MSCTRSQLPQFSSGEMETYEEAKEFCDRSSLLIPRVACRDMDILSCLRAWRRGLSVLSKGQGGGPDFFV